MSVHYFSPVSYRPMIGFTLYIIGSFTRQFYCVFVLPANVSRCIYNSSGKPTSFDAFAMRP